MDFRVRVLGGPRVHRLRWPSGPADDLTPTSRYGRAVDPVLLGPRFARGVLGALRQQRVIDAHDLQDRGRDDGSDRLPRSSPGGRQGCGSSDLGSSDTNPTVGCHGPVARVGCQRRRVRD